MASDNHSEVTSDDHSDAPSNYQPSDDYSDEPSDDHSDVPSNYQSSDDEPSDDHCDEPSDYPSDVPSDDRDEVSSDDRSEVSIMQSPKVQVISPKSVANFACKTCGEHVATILALEDHELREHTEPCVCQICERAGQPCNCGICKRASTVIVLVEDEKSPVNSEPDENACPVDSAGVIDLKAVEDPSIESRNSIVTVDFQEPIDPLLDEHREQTLLDMEHVVDRESSSGLTSPRPTSPPGNENDRLDSSTCRIT